MTHGALAPETNATAPPTAPQERGWRWFVLALVMMVVVTAAPAWPPALALIGGTIRLLLPIEQLALLVLVAIAACAVVGWWAGGRVWVALVWTLGAGLVVWRLPLPYQGYGAFVRGWALSLGAAFGLVCLATRARPFLGRALGAVALSGVVTLAGLSGRVPGALAAGDASVLGGATRMLETEYSRRLDEALTVWRERTGSEVWRTFAARMPAAAERAERTSGVLVSLSDRRGGLLRLAPALLALESLAALALGWATYHRLSRVRIGPPLAPLQALRFNDQLVWGLVVGAVLLLLPTLADWRSAGANVVCFFGTLYALRGLGVLTWWIPDRVAVAALLALVIVVPLLGPVLVLAATLVITFGLGLGDTWRDFRALANAGRPRSRP